MQVHRAKTVLRADNKIAAYSYTCAKGHTENFAKTVCLLLL